MNTHPRFITDAKRIAVLARVAAGQYVSDIARAEDVARSTVRGIAKRAGALLTPMPPKRRIAGSDPVRVQAKETLATYWRGQAYNARWNDLGY